MESLTEQLSLTTARVANCSPTKRFNQKHNHIPSKVQSERQLQCTLWNLLWKALQLSSIKQLDPSSWNHFHGWPRWPVCTVFLSWVHWCKAVKLKNSRNQNKVHILSNLQKSNPCKHITFNKFTNFNQDFGCSILGSSSLVVIQHLPGNLPKFGPCSSTRSTRDSLYCERKFVKSLDGLLENNGFVGEILLHLVDFWPSSTYLHHHVSAHGVGLHAGRLQLPLYWQQSLLQTPGRAGHDELLVAQISSEWTQESLSVTLCFSLTTLLSWHASNSHRSR